MQAPSGRLLRAGVLSLAGLLAAATVADWGVRVAQDAHLVAPAPTQVISDRNGAFLTQVGHDSVRPDGGRQVEYGYWKVPPPPRVVQATLALEDRRFRDWPGVDPLAALRAVWQHATGRHGSGASTLAMQVARMQHPRPRTLWSKAIEAGTAVALTLRYGHDAVLAQYLRLAPYGEGSHGIAHAAWWYFDRPAADLDWAQAALLAAIPQAPGLMALHHGLPRAVARGRTALIAMHLPPPDLAAAEAELTRLAPRATPRRPDALQAVLRLDRMVRTSPDTSPDGAVQRRATLDLAMQNWVANLAGHSLTGWRRDGADQVAAMVVQRRSRAVLVDVASAGYRTAPAGAIDYSAVPRSPGSTLKPFLYALALDRGLITPDKVVADLPQGAAGISNADRTFLGPLLPRQALANSRNVPAAILLRRIGLADGFHFLHALGLHALSGPAERYGLAMAIGAMPTGLDRLVRAYATLAENGVDDDLLWLEAGRRDPHPVISPDTARLVGSFLSDPLARLPSFPRYGASEFPFAVAVKTGTSQGYRDAWTLEWSDKYLVGVWVGRADAGPMRGLGGGTAAAALAQAIMLRLHGATRSDLLAGALPSPSAWRETELCAATGTPAGLACTERLAEWVRPGAPPVPARPSPALAIIQPDPDTRIWRNPNAPPGLDRLVLRAAASPGVPQIVWLVDGQPVATAPPGAPLYWRLSVGRHRFQIRLPLQDVVSRPVAVDVQ